jgi:hypothetical protein
VRVPSLREGTRLTAVCVDDSPASAAHVTSPQQAGDQHSEGRSCRIDAEKAAGHPSAGSTLSGIDVLLLDQHDPAFVLGPVRGCLAVVGEEAALNGRLEDGIGGVGGGELMEVTEGFEMQRGSCSTDRHEKSRRSGSGEVELD